jgi:hypothetical protein
MMGLMRIISPRLASIVAGVLFFAIPALSQPAATITYTQDFPGSDPSHYIISTVLMAMLATRGMDGSLRPNIN